MVLATTVHEVQVDGQIVPMAILPRYRLQQMVVFHLQLLALPKSYESFIENMA
jgi:hypothetical protein